MKPSVLALVVTGVVGAGCGSIGHGRMQEHPPSARAVAHAVRTGSSTLGLAKGETTTCQRTDGGVAIGFGWEEFVCGYDVHCSVEWGIRVAGRRTDFYDCARPNGDSFYEAEVCVVASRGRLAIDQARTAAFDGPEYPCPYHSED